MRFIKSIANDTAGSTAIEYAVIIALIGLGLSATLSGIATAFIKTLATATAAMPL